MISRYHGFFAPSVKDSYYGIFYLFNPETQGGPKNKFLTENTSEYHRSNIQNYPKHKKYMEDFVINAAYEHKKFEKLLEQKTNLMYGFIILFGLSFCILFFLVFISQILEFWVRSH